MSSGTNIHIYPSDMTAESRMMKITASLREFGYFKRILLIGIQSAATAAHEVIDETREIYRFPRGIGIVRGRLLRKLWATIGWSWAIWKFTRDKPITVINCHSLPVLPLCVALKLRHRALLVYDTHELETETTESRGVRRRFAKLLERALIGFSDLTFVVGEMIAQWYADTYRMAKPVLIRNIPELGSSVAIGGGVQDSPLRAKRGLDADAIIVLYVGKLSANRGIERLLDLFSKLHNPIHLVCMGDGALVGMIQEYAKLHPTIHWLPPVPYAQVVSYARGADIGVSVIDHSCLSYTYAMPNKFFEYLQAGVPILIGDMPEQRAIVEEHQVGWVLPEGDEGARLFIDSLSKDDIRQKQRNTVAVSTMYSWERERETLHAAYEKLRAAHSGKF
jgi:glycosyltransferase involved in cell wall biosynthesis